MLLELFSRRQKLREPRRSSSHRLTVEMLPPRLMLSATGDGDPPPDPPPPYPTPSPSTEVSPP